MHYNLALLFVTWAELAYLFSITTNPKVIVLVTEMNNRPSEGNASALTHNFSQHWDTRADSQ